MRTQTNANAIRESIVFGLGVFILFILLFEQRLDIPQWLQPVGRMHPLILHLPVVLLMLSLALEYLRWSKVSQSNFSSFQALAGILLFGGVLTSGLAAIMGIFLGREEGYTQEALQPHKWTGVAVFFLAGFIFMVRRSSWYNAVIARVGAVATTLCLLVAGHLGGSVTHGNNFVFDPVFTKEETVTVPFEQARIYPDVIKPLLESKCVSCHNAEKRKGKLLLSDEETIRKGGKSGVLFVAGNPDSSLLVQRIHLPLEHKKHMPPSGKPQLTDVEKELFYQWVLAGSSFETKLSDLEESDSLRLAATNFLNERTGEEIEFDFPAAADQTLAKLNSNYRVVRPVSRHSPALAVNIYNREVYSPRTLEELKDVTVQVISLDLTKMPVKDGHLIHVSRFENLRSLNLNFTDITGEGLASLQRLERLEELSLSGTRVTHAELEKVLPALKSLRTVSLWNTPLTEEQVVLLEEAYPAISFIAFSEHGRTLIKLNPPRIKNRYRVFRDTIALQLFHPVRDTDIRFTLDGKDADSLSAESFQDRIVIDRSVAINARAYKDGWLSSDAATLNLYRCKYKPDTAILTSRLNRVHPANGAMTFFDHELGGFNANSPAWANNWAGFIRNDMVLHAYYNSPVQVGSVSLNTLIEPETSIFPPAVIEVWGGRSENVISLLAREQVELPGAYRKPYIQLHDVRFTPEEVSYIKIIAKPVMELPAWHKNKKKPALMLIDEILIN